MDRDTALRFLFDRLDYEKLPAIPYQATNLKLDRMRQLLARIGNPHEKLPIVHVAGSKGKGSTAAMIAGVLTAAGYKTGLYTSPHLHRLEERIAIGGQPCSSADLIQLITEIQPAVDAMDRESRAAGKPKGGPTYFDITTALAMLHFAKVRVDSAVFEVGMGGRLDSTNVCRPIATVITSISHDHTRQLGSTLSEIAREKAGIIKDGVPLINGVIGGEAREVITRTASEHGSRVRTIQSDFGYRYYSGILASTGGDTFHPCSFDYWCQHGSESTYRLKSVLMGMPGRHQAANAAVAMATIDVLRGKDWAITEPAIRQGIRRAVCPARIEILRANPWFVVDAAHNETSIRATIDTLDELPVHGRRTVIFGTTRGKDAKAMLKVLVERVDRIILTQYKNNPRSVDATKLARFIKDNCGSHARNQQAIVEIVPDSEQALRLAWEAQSASDLLCVTGSFFLASEMRHPMRELSRQRDNRVELAQSSSAPL